MYLFIKLRIGCKIALLSQAWLIPLEGVGKLGRSVEAISARSNLVKSGICVHQFAFSKKKCFLVTSLTNSRLRVLGNSECLGQKCSIWCNVLCPSIRIE